LAGSGCLLESGGNGNSMVVGGWVWGKGRERGTWSGGSPTVGCRSHVVELAGWLALRWWLAEGDVA
jgi:hypothetical protein